MPSAPTIGSWHWLDLAIAVFYVAGIVATGCWIGWRRRGGVGGARGYFLADRSLRWPVIGLALFATNISTVHLVSLAQSGFDHGLAYGNFEWMAIFTLIALSLFFAPFYFRSGVATLPDFLERRYDRSCRNWLAMLSIVSAIVIHIGFSLYTGAIVLRGMFGIGITASIVGIAGLTGLYTIVGGLTAVVVTESIQTVVLLAGAVCITAIAYHRAGGWAGIVEATDPVRLTLMRPHGDSSGLPWYSVVLGYPVIGLWYWCADQTIVQRVLGARDIQHARMGPLFAAFIKILPVFIFVLPGVICATLVAQGRLPVESMAHVTRPDGTVAVDSNDTYAFMIRELLPAGLKGLVASALLAALMSTVSGALNSIGTLFSYDLLKQWRPAATERQLITAGRWASGVAMVLAILWSPQLEHFDGIFEGLNAIISYLAPPVTAVFLFGVFWERASAVAARLTLWIGSALGFGVFLLDWNGNRTGWHVQPLLSAFGLFIASAAILGIVSLARPHRPTEATRDLVWSRPWTCLTEPGWPGLADYRVVASVLLVTILTLYAIF